MPVAALGLLERRGLALEDPLVLLGHREPPQQSPAPRPRRRPPRGPGTRLWRSSWSTECRPAASGWSARDHGQHVVQQELELHQPVQRRGRGGPDRHVDGAPGQQHREPRHRLDAQLDLEVGRAPGEQVDQSGRRVLGEQVRRRDPEHPAPVTGLADLAGGAVLQAEDLDRPAGQPQAARGERQAGGGAGEEHVVELLAQLGDVHRDRRLADARAPWRPPSPSPA